MTRKMIVRGAFAGALLLAPGFVAIGHASDAGMRIAQQDGAEELPKPDPRLEVPEITDPPETLIPEQIYPCNPGSFEPSDELAEPEKPRYADDCEGVIEPPVTNDAEIDVQPPEPNAGTMRIIKPEEIVPD